MSVGKALRKLERDDEAAEHMAEALRIFRKTCGEASPLACTEGVLAPAEPVISSVS